MNRSGVTWLGLGVVASAAAVLSFASLRNLAVVCGTSPVLAWLLPVCIDAAALAATRVWLTGGASEDARRSARWLALTMIVLSVAGNATDHALAAYGVRPPWWAVVAVAAVPPAVLGAVAHLAALVLTKGRPRERAEDAAAPSVAAVTGRAVQTGPDGPSDAGERTDDSLLVELRAMAAAEGGTPSLTAVWGGLRVGTGRARRLLDRYAVELDDARDFDADDEFATAHAVGGGPR